MGARVLDPDEVDALARLRLRARRARRRSPRSGQSCVEPRRDGRLRGRRRTTKVLLAPLPTDLAELAAHPLVHEKLMPVLGLVRSPSVEHGIAACELVTEHGGLGHTSAVYAQRRGRDRALRRAPFAPGASSSTRPTAVGALGGVYNSLTPTFSLGCGTWGGSTTTDNVNYRNLLNIKVVSRRQAPPQWFRVPVRHVLQHRRAREPAPGRRPPRSLIVTDADTEARGVVDEVRRHLGDGRRARVRRRAARAERGRDPRRRARCSTRAAPTSIVAVGGGSVIDAAKAMRLFHEHPELSLRELSLPFLDARKRVAAVPADRPHASSWSRSRRRPAPARRSRPPRC